MDSHAYVYFSHRPMETITGMEMYKTLVHTMVHETNSVKVCSGVYWCRKVVRKCELRKLNKHETEIKRCSDTWLWIIEVVIVLFLCFRRSYKVVSAHSMSYSGRDSSQ